MKELRTSLTPGWDRLVKEATNTTQDGIHASTAWANVLWERMKEPVGDLVSRELLRFLRVPKTGRRFGRGLMRPPPPIF